MKIDASILRLAGLALACLGATISLPATSSADTRVIPADVVNIAAAANGGRVLGATSTLNDDQAYKPANLIDGSVYDAMHNKGSYGWASNRFDPIAMDAVIFAFKDNAVKQIGKLVLNPAANVTPERWAKDIEVQVSNDTAEGPYRAVAQLTIRQSPERQEFTILPVQARFMRLMFRSNWGSDRSVALGEVEVYESIGTGDPVGAVIGQLESTLTDLRRYRATQVGALNAGIENVASSSAAPSDTIGRNIASSKMGGRIAEVSSTFVSDPAQGADPAYKAENLLDGEVYLEKTDKGSYGWASQGFRKGQEFVTIAFKDDRTRLINKFKVNASSNQARLRWVRKGDVQVTTGSAKDGPWRTVTSFSIRDEDVPITQEFVLVRPVEAKFVRFVFTGNGPGGSNLPKADPDVDSDRAVSLGEIEIYEAPVGGQELDVLIGRFGKALNELKQLRNKDLTAHAIDPAVQPAPAAAHPRTKPGKTPAAPPRVQTANKKQPVKPTSQTYQTREEPLARHSSKFFVAVPPYL